MDEFLCVVCLLGTVWDFSFAPENVAILCFNFKAFNKDFNRESLFEILIERKRAF